MGVLEEWGLLGSSKVSGNARYCRLALDEERFAFNYVTLEMCTFKFIEFYCNLDTVRSGCPILIRIPCQRYGMSKN